MAWKSKEYEKRYKRKYYNDHRNEIIKYQKDRRDTKPELKHNYNRSFKGKYTGLLSHAKYKGIEVTISFENYKEIASLLCFYCGGSLPETGSGLDRINSEIGYVIGNVRPCCIFCNKSKLDRTESEFKEWSLRLYNHWSSK